MEACGKLDLCNKNIRKLDKSIAPSYVNLNNVISIDLTGNSLQRLDNIDMFPELIELNVSRNQLLRMYNLIKLQQLVKVDLSNNHILSIEGLKELKNLKYLNLSHNNIKVLDTNHLQANSRLEHLDLSYNSITLITNIAHLTLLKVLYLQKNQIINLRHCKLYLPGNIEVLSLANNSISDLNEISNLAQLCNLKELSITGNPCVTMTGGNIGFDYRPFVLNWCNGLRAIDGYAVDDIENLKAEWLYSQGKGRKFKIGEHTALVHYLAAVCPISGKTLETVNDRKLRLILNKAQQHQKQLKDQPNTGILRSSSRRSLPSVQSNLMTRSLDPQCLSRKTSTVVSGSDTSSQVSENFEDFAERRMTRSAQWPEYFRTDSLDRSKKIPYTNGEPLPTSTALVPAPDSLISPSIASSLPFYSNSLPQKRTEIVEDDVELCSAKLMTIKNKVYEKVGQTTGNSEKKNNLNEAATCIQKIWRGYQTRVLNKRVSDVYQQIQTLRFNQYIKKLSVDMEATKAALDKEHQLQILQMEAISALCKKISALQSTTEETQDKNQSGVDRVDQLDTQIQKLQGSVQAILDRMNFKDTRNAAISTQTEIVAVHTPKDDNTARTTILEKPPSDLSKIQK